MNNRRFLTIFAIAVALVMILAVVVYLVKQAQQPSIMLEVRVEGLQSNNERAELFLVPELLYDAEKQSQDKTPIPIGKVGNGEKTIKVRPLPDGTYKLVIQANPEYFRNPKGYLIGIKNNQIIRRRDKPLLFEFIPPTAQTLPPCRDDLDGSSGTGEICRSEGLIDLLGPPK